MARLTIKTKDNPKLQQSILLDGRISLYLEYYLGRNQWVDEGTGKAKIKHFRRKESLNLYLTASPRTTAERQTNKETLELAKRIRAEKEQEMKNDIHGYRLSKSKNINFLDYFQAYIDSYTKKDVRHLRAGLRKFKDFLSLSYPIYQTSIKPEQITKEMMEGFVGYLESKSIGSGAHTVYQRFKKVIKYAYENGIIKRNPCNKVPCKIDTQTLRKDVLSMEEMKKLVETTYLGQNPVIRRAFIFSLYTGIRFCDIIELRYSNVDYANMLLKFEQTKTKGHSQYSGVVIPLNDSHIQLIGAKPDKDDYIFPLPSHTMCLKALRHWTARAGIDKHITWHCARHSFAVNILNNGANIKTVASLLGHSGLQSTEKYTRAVDKLKQAAIDSLPELKL